MEQNEIIDLVKDFIKENLKIRIETGNNRDLNEITVYLLLDGAVIDKSSEFI